MILLSKRLGLYPWSETKLPRRYNSNVMVKLNEHCMFGMHYPVYLNFKTIFCLRSNYAANWMHLELQVQVAGIAQTVGFESSNLNILLK